MPKKKLSDDMHNPRFQTAQADRSTKLSLCCRESLLHALQSNVMYSSAYWQNFNTSKAQHIEQLFCDNKLIKRNSSTAEILFQTSNAQQYLHRLQDAVNLL